MKQAKTIQFKALGAGKAVRDDQMAKINKFALVELKSDQVYVRRYLMAHNGIDRDNERFSEKLLDDYKNTLTGKGFFVEGHPSSWGGKGGPGEGRFFDAATQEMSPEEFKQLTGEEIDLPEGVNKAKVLWGDAYLLKLDSNSETLAKIDAGIYSFASIGFNAPLVEVTDKNGNNLYGEYRSKGEAREGSLVWLGAQQGASAMKATKTDTEVDKNKLIVEEIRMKEFLKKLSEKLGKVLTEENVIEEVAAIVSEKDAEIALLKPLAEEGKSYRKHLVDDVLRFGVLIEEIPTDEDKQKKEAEFITTWPIDRIKALKDRYETRAREKFPDKFDFKSKDETDRKMNDEEARKQKQQATTGRKDYTSPEHNELFATVGK